MAEPTITIEGLTAEMVDAYKKRAGNLEDIFTNLADRAQRAGIPIEAFVESINGVANNADNNTFWMFYVNGGLADVGASDYIVKDSDRIEWKYIDTSDMGF